MYKHVLPALACVTLLALGPAPVMAAPAPAASSAGATTETSKDSPKPTQPEQTKTEQAASLAETPAAAPDPTKNATMADKDTGKALKEAQQAYDNGDFIETFVIVEPLAKLNHPYAQYLLGLMYEFGNGVKQDTDKARDLFVKSASQGFAAAQEHLGRIQMKTQKEYDSALGWFSKAADQGYALGYSALGDMYAGGYGVEKNMDTAISYFQKAALSGDAKACLKLGQIYEKGEGVDADLKQAKFWFQKGAEAGNAECAENLARLNTPKK